MSRIERRRNIYKIDDFSFNFQFFFRNKAEYCNLQQIKLTVNLASFTETKLRLTSFYFTLTLQYHGKQNFNN